MCVVLKKLVQIVLKLRRKCHRLVVTTSDLLGLDLTHPLPASTSALLAKDLVLVLAAHTALEAAALAAVATDAIFRM